MFLDEAVVELISGNGGNGSASFRHEKHVPRGGPNGSDGGKGGDIILIADRSKRTLYDFRLRRTFRAENGVKAHGNKRGRDAASVEIRLPVGTVVSDAESGRLIADLDRDGVRVVVCRGGRGGFGNLRFASSVRQAPDFAENGEPGERVLAQLELKLLADIGIVGLPNAGKSTLISSISAAKPKIADYPFTTIVPNLGVVSVGDFSFTVADLPGLIEGASSGQGLGLSFLRHAERTAALLHVVECLPLDGTDPSANFDLIENELRQYAEGLWSKTRLVALSKVDLLDPEALEGIKASLETRAGKVFPISSATGEGLEPLLYAMAEVIRNAPEPPSNVLRIEPEAPKLSEWEVRREDGGFRIIGKDAERAVAMTQFSSRQAIYRLHRRLERMGVIEALRQKGAEEGDTVFVGDHEFNFSDEA